jgi:ABC-type glutathione transport system ATPase component
MSTLASAPSPLLDVRGLSKRYDVARRHRWPRWPFRVADDAVQAVADVSFTLHRGEVLGIVGESGSGKTTVARMLVRLVAPTAGQILLDGRDICLMSPVEVRTHVRSQVRLIFQDPDAVLNPMSTIGESLARALALHGQAGSDASRFEHVVAQLERVGLPANCADKYPDALSGGEKRRIGICRALATHPSVIVADEPLSGLDVMLQEHVLSLLCAEQAQRNFGLILVSHDLDRVQQVCDRILVMYGGRVVENVATNRGSARHRVAYTHPYSQALEAARLEVSGGAAAA